MMPRWRSRRKHLSENQYKWVPTQNTHPSNNFDIDDFHFVNKRTNGKAIKYEKEYFELLSVNMGWQTFQIQRFTRMDER